MKTFEEFLLEKHAECYRGTNNSRLDDFNKWITKLSTLEYADFAYQYRNEQTEYESELFVKAALVIGAAIVGINILK